METYLERFMAGDAYARHCGIELVSAGDGRAAARAVVGAQHLNGAGAAHGGFLFSVADLAFAAACNSRGTVTVGIDVHIAYISAVRQGETIIAEAEEVSAKNHLGRYRILVYAGEERRLAAEFNGLAYRTKQPHADK